MLAKAIDSFNLCRELQSKGEFHDWVVISAFYSAMHYATNCIFNLPGLQLEDPRSGRFRNFANFNEYLYAWKLSGKEHTPHKLRKELVSEHLSEVQFEYRTLFDSCMTSRYNFQRADELLADQAWRAVNQIKQFCESQIDID